MGTVVEVGSGANGNTTPYTMLGAWDGDPDKNVISYKTALRRGSARQEAGEVVKVKLGGNEEEYTIVNISRVYAAT